MSHPSSGGFRPPKKLSKRDVQLALQQEKATNARLLEHLNVMGPLMQRMMVGSWQALRMAHRTRRDLEVVVTLPAKQTQDVKDILEKVCDQVAEGAAAWRESLEPDFIKADFMGNVGRGITAGEAFDEAVKSGAGNSDLEQTCTSCDWAGFIRECQVNVEEGGLLCPICGKEVKEVYTGGSEETQSEETKQVGEEGQGPQEEGPSREAPGEES